MQMICEWVHGPLPDGGEHKDAVVQALNAMNNAMRKLRNQKHGCAVPEDVDKDVQDMNERLGADGDKLALLPHRPKVDFQAHCVAEALSIAAKKLGR